MWPYLIAINVTVMSGASGSSRVRKILSKQLKDPHVAKRCSSVPAYNTSFSYLSSSSFFNITLALAPLSSCLSHFLSFVVTSFVSSPLQYLFSFSCFQWVVLCSWRFWSIRWWRWWSSATYYHSSSIVFFPTISLTGRQGRNGGQRGGAGGCP